MALAAEEFNYVLQKLPVDCELTRALAKLERVMGGPLPPIRLSLKAADGQWVYEKRPDECSHDGLRIVSQHPPICAQCGKAMG